MTRTNSISFTKTHTRIALTATLALLAITGTAALAQSQADVEKLLQQADANRDGEITWAEVEKLRASSFARLDRNGDGYIDNADRPRMFAGRFDEAMEKVSRFDTNGDGRISQSEMMNAEAPAFTKADVNGDQIVTSEEIKAMRASR